MLLLAEVIAVYCLKMDVYTVYPRSRISCDSHGSENIPVETSSSPRFGTAQGTPKEQIWFG